jgi:uncharacterized repeat protein (TIGR03803 family)
LYSFTGGNDGGNPMAGLILSGNSLYGTTEYGGTNGSGTVFALNTNGTANGTGYTNLYSFTALSGSASTNRDGANPMAGLVLSGNTLYGTEKSGGSSGVGTMFSIHTDGSGFTNYSLSISTGDSSHPVAGFVLSGNTLYGTTANGGGYGYASGYGYGTVFSLSLGPVVVLTPATITGISLSGVNLVINGSNGQSGGTYQTLTTTNLTLNQWMPVATNILNMSGIFSFTATNVVNSADPQRFFRIVQTQ